jgi:hypothetical protein
LKNNKETLNWNDNIVTAIFFVVNNNFNYL